MVEDYDSQVGLLEHKGQSEFKEQVRDKKRVKRLFLVAWELNPAKGRLEVGSWSARGKLLWN